MSRLRLSLRPAAPLRAMATRSARSLAAATPRSSPRRDLFAVAALNGLMAGELGKKLFYAPPPEVDEEAALLPVRVARLAWDMAAIMLDEEAEMFESFKR